MNKKALELSLTVIVIIILSIIIFIGGVALVYQFFAGAEELKAGIERRTQEQIEALVREGNQIVAIPFNKKTVSAGQQAVFGLGIRNVESTKEFSVSLSFVGGFDRQGKRLEQARGDDPGVKSFVEQNWLGNFQKLGPYEIKQNKIEVIPIIIRAHSEVYEGVRTSRGNYVFNVCVFKMPTPEPCELDNPNVYDKIRQVTVEVK